MMRIKDLRELYQEAVPGRGLPSCDAGAYQAPRGIPGHSYSLLDLDLDIALDLALALYLSIRPQSYAIRIVLTRVAEAPLFRSIHS
jgi:hypothetical protein